MSWFLGTRKEADTNLDSHKQQQLIWFSQIRISVFSLLLDVFNGVLRVANPHTRVEFV